MTRLTTCNSCWKFCDYVMGEFI